MNLKNISIIFLLIFVSVLCTGSFFIEKKELAKDESGLRTLVQVIENAIWNYDYKGPVEYLKLAARHQSYELIKIYAVNNELFLEIDGPKLGTLDQFLVKIGLIQIRKLNTDISRSNKNIGRVEVSHRHDSIYQHLYWFITLGLTFIVAIFFVRISYAKRILKQQANELEVNRDRLEEVVEERTNELSQSEKKYRALFENEQDAIIIYDPKTMIISDANPAMSEIYGYSHEELVGMDCLELSAEVQKSIKTASKASKSGQFSVKLRWHKKKDGTVFPLELVVYSIELSGKLVGFTVIKDLTEQKKAQKEKKNLENRLNQAQKMEAIGTLAGGIAHDFNNILGAILGYAEMARDDCPSGTTVVKDLDKVLEASNRAKDLVTQILAFSRQGDAERIPVQPTSIVGEAIKMLRPSLPATIEINQDITSTTSLVLADPTQIHQILMNLCTNAFHAMEETGGKLDIALKETHLGTEDLVYEPDVEPGTFIQLSVCDSGPGISPTTKERIFDPYFTTKENGKGTGMGLSIVHGIVKSYGGYISLYSELGEGTVFHVYLPVIEEDALPEIETIEQVVGGKERVLFIDDEKILTEMGKDMLERLGYHVTTRNSSLTALETFQNQPDQFDIVITDQTMTGMTGVDLARRMLQVRPDIPIILCTG